ncbi:MAG: hypothetical protein HC831_05320 [Chloroflexia bacterium]|nr:hypothetical protein [Bacteroidales bacterium]NJO88440.1 hypothetical protein [Chloroflexia bacterium]
MVTKHFGDIPEWVTCTPERTTGLTVINEDNEVYEFQDEGINILREKFDYWLNLKLKDKGVNIIPEARLLKYETNPDGFISTIRIKSNELNLQSKILIACDGVMVLHEKYLVPRHRKRYLHAKSFIKELQQSTTPNFTHLPLPVFHNTMPG